MRRYEEPRLPPDLETVATRLSEYPVEIGEPDLDRLKQRALTRSRKRHAGGFLMARLATALTALVLVGVLTGTFSVARVDRHPNANGGAANAQYTTGVSQGGTSGTSSGHALTISSTPAAATPTSGTLPFTGEEVVAVALVGLLLVGTGLLLRVPARRRRRE